MFSRRGGMWGQKRLRMMMSRLREDAAADGEVRGAVCLECQTRSRDSG
jgi:hypothetical protein